MRHTDTSSVQSEHISSPNLTTPCTPHPKSQPPHDRRSPNPASFPSDSSLVPSNPQSGEVSGHFLSSALSWRWLRVLLLVWLGGVLIGLVAMTPTLPEYDLAVENQTTARALELGPMSYLKVALTPKEDTSTLPKLCGFTWDGASLRRWPVPYIQSHRGTLLIKGELRDLLPLAASPASTIKELVFVISSPLSLCQPAGVALLQSLDALAEPWLGRTVSSLLGVRTLRLPVRLHPARP